jgi:hypothetical protein
MPQNNLGPVCADESTPVHGVKTISNPIIVLFILALQVLLALLSPDS